jgi:hypothetical protein
MSSHSKLITLVTIALAVSFLSFGSQALSSDVSNLPKNIEISETPRIYDTPKYFVPPHPFQRTSSPARTAMRIWT